ncbi:tetratricopeptide repeat protein [Corallococcus exiguus]|uniref:tetratricopeptide repeat protein n=1 Tax=Corallococcus TaxID=83461 RepID=UPI000EE812B1|nr:tetratricopeptide repeat protein [Corallococcus sp. AB032C]NNB90985.1 tetratricopeptide repeat protein [Corallococcus exiguus]NNC07640.1 tetratricopeptide repeat protein [Corallococcus exiguus]NPC51639.1 tetratricopeptide repeat protein [Corallococcus exiguus]RKH80720.1 tetratricopeptide repeat protein [Corallococcus sp. AB032C]
MKTNHSIDISSQLKGMGTTGMNGFRTKRMFLAGAFAFAFTTACATGPRPTPVAMNAVEKPAVTVPAAAPPPAPAEKGDADGQFAQALKAYEAGDLDAARKGFEAVVSHEPKALNARFNLGVIADKQGRPADARVAYEQVLALNPAHTPSVMNLGLMHRHAGQLDEALGLYTKALQTPGHEHDEPVLNALAATYRLAGKLDEAEATGRRVLARSKDNPEAYKTLALVAYDRGQYRLAELLVINARKVAQDDPAISNTLGMIYLKMDDRPRALAQFQKAVSLDDNFAPGHLNLGALALSYRDYAGAEKAFTKALSLEPDGLEGQLYLAYALDGQKGLDPKKGVAAGEAFEKVLARSADKPEAVCGAGWAYATERAAFEKAIAFLDRCKDLSSTTDQDKQLITAKVNGLQNMLKNPPPAPAATAEAEGEEKKDAAATGGAGSSVMNQLPQDTSAPEQEAPAEPAADDASGNGQTAPTPAPTP